MTKDEAQFRYLSFRRGFIEGASGKSALDAFGTEEPEFRDEYEKGFEHGQNVFRTAMKNKWESLIEPEIEGLEPVEWVPGVGLCRK